MRVLSSGLEVARFTYDGFGRRVEKVAGGVTRTYIYDGEDLVEERAGGTTTRIVHGPGIDQPLAAVTGTTPMYYLADHLGSIAQHTNSAQQVTLTRTYDPFGNLTSGAATSGYAFTGREWDAEIGLYYDLGSRERYLRHLDTRLVVLEGRWGSPPHTLHAGRWLEAQESH